MNSCRVSRGTWARALAVCSSAPCHIPGHVPMARKVWRAVCPFGDTPSRTGHSEAIASGNSLDFERSGLCCVAIEWRTLADFVTSVFATAHPVSARLYPPYAYSRADQIVPRDRWTSQVNDNMPVDTIGESLSDWTVWSVVTEAAREIGIENFGAHDLRRTCAKLCRKAGGDLEQIKFCWATLRFRRRNATSGRSRRSLSP